MEENKANLYGGFPNRSSGGSIPNLNPNPVWDLWAPTPNSNFRINTTNPTIFTAGGDTPNTVYQSEDEAYESMYNSHGRYDQLSLYTGGRDGSHLHPDPHLTCLKLGKRQYFGDTFPAGDIGKRIKPYFGDQEGTSSVPRCQVQGCHVGLGNAKDYHRRHKVCEMHSKAPKVVVLGLEQRFCQQCSRFHVVSEFDESKRSCRRRLAGHNERRRKSANDSVPRNTSLAEKITSGKYATESALSLLSANTDGWNINSSSSSDISSRSSAALRELIAENRAAILSKHNSIHQSSFDSNCHQFIAHPNTQWDRQETVTLDLMQPPTASPFGYVPKHKKEDDEADQECSLLWNMTTWTGLNHL